MDKDQEKRCHAIIHTAAAATAAIGAGFAQLPCSDNIAIIPMQMIMVVSLGSVFGIRLQQTTAESTLGTATATVMGRSISQTLIGWVPVFGNICNAVTAGLVTETIGWAIAHDFASRTSKSKGKGV